MADVKLNILAQLKGIEDATRGIERFARSSSDGIDRVERQLERTGGAFRKIGEVAAGVFTANAIQAGLQKLESAFQDAVKNAVQLENSLLGLRSVAKATGNNVEFVEQKAKELSADGLIPLADVAASLKNLLATGLSAEESVKTFLALRDAASFNRQGQLSLGDAVRGASEGIKNQNSIMVDNAGITKNISVILREYSGLLGKAAKDLSDNEKAQVIALGIQKEALLFQGDYNKLLQTFSGALSKVGGETLLLSVSFGELVTKNKAAFSSITALAESVRSLRIFMTLNRDAILDVAGAITRLAAVAASIAVFTQVRAVVAAFVTTMIAAGTQVTTLGVAVQATSFSRFIAGLAASGISLEAFKASAIGARIATAAFYATLTVGITLLVEFGIRFAALVEEFGSFTGGLKALGLSAQLTFNNMAQAVNVFIRDALVSFSKLPGVGKLVAGAIEYMDDQIKITDRNTVNLVEDFRKLEFFAKDRGLASGVKALGDAATDTGQKLTKELLERFETLEKKFKYGGLSPFQRIKQEKDDALKLLDEVEAKDQKMADRVQALRSKVLANYVKEYRDAHDKAAQQFEKLGKTQVEQIEIEKRAKLKQLDEYERQGVLSAKEVAEYRLQVEKEASEKITDEQEKQFKKSLERIKKLGDAVQVGIGAIGSVIPSPEVKVDIEPVIEAERRLRDARIKGVEDLLKSGSISKDERDERIEMITRETEAKEKQIKFEADERKKQLEQELKYRDAAAKLFAEGLGKIADAFLPGIGGVVSSIIELASKGSEAVAKAFEGLVRAMPEVLKNIIASLPTVITSIVGLIGPLLEAVASQLGELITGLIEAVPQIVFSLVNGAVQFVFALIQEIPNIVIALLDGVPLLIERFLVGIPEIIQGIVARVPDLIQALVQRMPEIITKLVTEAPRIILELIQHLPKLILELIAAVPRISIELISALVREAPYVIKAMIEQIPKFVEGLARGIVDAIKDLIGGIGSEGGIAGTGILSDQGILGIEGIPLLARGGMVPPGFPNDSFMAGLQTGELVVDRSTTEALQDFLSQQRQNQGLTPEQMAQIMGQGGAQNLQITLQVGEKELAQVMLNLKRQGYRVA